MKNLYLLRHANAHPVTNEGDKNRILTPKGVKEIKILADAFLEKDALCDLVLCSTAVRTKQTWHHLANFTKLNFNVNYTEELYNPSIDDYLEILKNIPENCNHVMSIGHNPTTSEVANYLLGKDNITFSTANMAYLKLSIDNWRNISKGCATLEWFIPNQ